MSQPICAIPVLGGILELDDSSPTNELRLAHAFYVKIAGDLSELSREPYRSTIREKAEALRREVAEVRESIECELMRRASL